MYLVICLPSSHAVYQKQLGMQSPNQTCDCYTEFERKTDSVLNFDINYIDIKIFITAHYVYIIIELPSYVLAENVSFSDYFSQSNIIDARSALAEHVLPCRIH